MYYGLDPPGSCQHMLPPWLSVSRKPSALGGRPLPAMPSWLPPRATVCSIAAPWLTFAVKVSGSKRNAKLLVQLWTRSSTPAGARQSQHPTPKGGDRFDLTKLHYYRSGGSILNARKGVNSKCELTPEKEKGSDATSARQCRGHSRDAALSLRKRIVTTDARRGPQDRSRS